MKPHPLPIIITSLRFVLAPIFCLIYFLDVQVEGWNITRIILLPILMGVIGLSDILDGFLARKLKAVSPFGKTLDPLADLFTHFTYFSCFAIDQKIPIWCFILIMYREIGMAVLRISQALEGEAIAARIGGKIKAFGFFLLSCTVITYIILLETSDSSMLHSVFQSIVFWGSGLVTLIAAGSFIDYMVQWYKFERRRLQKERLKEAENT